jgi:hypothetical protein
LTLRVLDAAAGDVEILAFAFDAGEFRARPLEQWARQRPALSAHELRLNGEAEGWALRYLAGHEREARALQIWLGSKVTGRVKVPREVAKQGWSRSMYSRARRSWAPRIKPCSSLIIPSCSKGIPITKTLWISSRPATAESSAGRAERKL